MQAAASESHDQSDWYPRLWRLFINVSIFGIGTGLFLMYRTVREVSRQNVATILIHLHEAYASREMFDALHAIWNSHQDEFDTNPERQQQRRLVLHFWELIGALVKGRVVEEDLLLDRFRDQVSVWEKLKPLQIRAVEKIIKERYPEMGPADTTALATDEVSTSNIEWLYDRWKNERRQMFRRDS